MSLYICNAVVYPHNVLEYGDVFLLFSLWKSSFLSLIFSTMEIDLFLVCDHDFKITVNEN